MPPETQAAAPAEEEDFNIVEGDAPPADEKAPPAANEDGGDDDDDGDDDRTAAEADGEEVDDEREHIRERRREERRLRKEQRQDRERRAKLLISSQQRTIDELNQRLQTVERRTSGSEIAQIDRAIQEAQAEIDRAQAAIKEAFTTGNGDLHLKAQQHWMNYSKRRDELQEYRQRATQVAQPGPVQLDQATRSNAENWMKANPWYDPQGKDLDSGVVLRIDAALAQEGFDARTPEYWEELNARAAQYLPHRMKRQGTQAPPARTKQAGTAQAGGSGREGSSAANGKRTVYLSPARVQAIKDAGRWDNLAERNKMIKAYLDYDKNQGA